MTRIGNFRTRPGIGSRSVATAKLIMLIAVLAGCSSTPRQDGITRASRSATVPNRALTRRESTVARGQLIAERALDMVGVPYQYGGERPETGFDCSGLAYFAYRAAGIDIPRVSTDQFKAARKISSRSIDAGDLVFFQDQKKLSHVGIYIGNGMFVHAPSSGKTVSVASLSAPYYQRYLVGIGRLLPN